MPPKQAGWRIYKQQMGQLDHGDALWEPTPIYSYKRIKLGDVGYIRWGRFHLLFSAGCPLGLRQPGVDVPTTFEQLDVGHIISRQCRLHGYICTDTVKETGTGASVPTTPFLEPGVRFSFELTGKRGAALVTKYPTYREDIELESAFEEYTIRHYDSWVAFARGAQHGRDIKPVLVTGVDMTREFAMIAYSNKSTPLSCEFTVSDLLVGSAPASVWGAWHFRGSAHTNYGPQPCSPPLPPDLDSPNTYATDATQNEYNQCVFIRYYTMRRRALMFPKVIKAASGPHDCGPGSNYDETFPELTVQSDTDSDAGSNRSRNSTTNYSSLVTSHESELKIFRNVSSGEEDTFDIIARYAFENSEAEAVLLHHRDIAQMREGMAKVEMSELLSERQPLIVVDSVGVGRLVHQRHQQLTVALPGTTGLSSGQHHNISRGMGILFPFRFGRNSRADRGPQIPSPDRNRPLPLLDNSVQLDPPDRHAVLSQWQRLGSLNPKSHEYIELLRTLVDVEGNRKVALKFTDNDARIAINIIGEALRGGRVQSKLAGHSFSMLRKLAGSTGQLPESYLVNKGVDYQVEERIFACGEFADIRKGKLAKKAVAIKTIRMTQDSSMSEIRKDFCKESVLWMHTSHPNVLELIAVDIDPQTRTFSMISELMVNGNIMEYIHVREANRIRLLEDVTRGLRYLHKCGIVHGDLKGTNILVKNGATPRACISHFGFSTLAPTTSFVASASVDECKGAWSHMAPELLHPEKFGLRGGRVSKQADIYAFGMVVYEVLTGHFPFGGEGRPQAEVISRVINGERPSKPKKAGGIGFGRGTWELVRRCWKEDRGERPTVEEIFKHFQHVAGSSTVLAPGSTTLAHEAERPTAFEPDSGFRDFAQLFTPSQASSQASTSILQKVKFTTDLMSGSGNLHPAFSVPSVQFIRAKPSLFDRLGARIKGWMSAPRVGAPTSPSART